MNRIILIIPYFGKFNNYFELWLESAKENLNIDFLIITDNQRPGELTDNIIWIEEKFHWIVDKVDETVQEFKPTLKDAYKLCDYKPLYGKLFKKYIKGYEFWGYCDIDLIFGNFDTFINDDMLKRYDKFYNRGHLTIYKNNEFFENLYRYEDVRMPVTYKEAWTTNYCCHFDEMPIWDAIIEENGYKCYENVDFADINIKSYRFQLAMGNENVEARQIFEKKGVKLYRWYINGELNRSEILYAHLQKRSMKIEIKNRTNNYYIVPNKFIACKKNNLLIQFIKDNSKQIFWKEYYNRRFKEIIKNIRNGALKMRWIRLKRRLHRTITKYV